MVFAIYFGYVLHLVGGLSSEAFGGSLTWIIGLRIGTQIGPGTHFSMLEFLSAELDALQRLFTPLMTFGAAAWLIILVVERIKGRHKGEHFDRLILALLMYGATYILIFRQPAYLHDYMVYYMAPAVAYGGVVAARYVIESCLAPKRWVRGIAVVILGYVFLFAGLPKFFELHRNPPRDDWIDLGKYLAQHTDPDEAVIVSWRDGQIYTEYYSDREILRNVTTVGQFQRALERAHNKVVVCMDYAEPRASEELVESCWGATSICLLGSTTGASLLMF
ncbi:MAG TPA: hypothetical protein VM163_07570 [bacterium]|nr:hypothetical protein [bacterium]